MGQVRDHRRGARSWAGRLSRASHPQPKPVGSLSTMGAGQILFQLEHSVIPGLGKASRVCPCSFLAREGVEENLCRDDPSGPGRPPAGWGPGEARHSRRAVGVPAPVCGVACAPAASAGLGVEGAVGCSAQGGFLEEAD